MIGPDAPNNPAAAGETGPGLSPTRKQALILLILGLLFLLYLFVRSL
ncbi:MAG: hypothetical protein HYX75_04765 [Acidobacteria bacterium]|nr:hypothetical protein [Acidobacteriota bacterium]